MSGTPYLALTGSLPRHPATTPLARMLRAYREEHRLSQARLAERLDVDHSHISRIESGTRTLGKFNVQVWAQRLGISEAHLALAAHGIDPGTYDAAIRADERRHIVAEIAGEGVA